MEAQRLLIDCFDDRAVAIREAGRCHGERYFLFQLVNAATGTSEIFFLND